MSKKKKSTILPVIGIGIAVLFISRIQKVKQPTGLKIDKRPRPGTV